MGAASIRIEQIRAALAARAPQVLPAGAQREAAVVLLLAEIEEDAHVLLIQRADRDGDPWSGHMAFPGGHRDPHDSDLFLTAARETLEEVGIDLHRDAEAIGRLDDLRAQSDRPLDLLIRPYVCAADRQLMPLANEREVRRTVWVPLSALSLPEVTGTLSVSLNGESATFPAYIYAGFTIWGLTYRMLTALLQTVVDAPLPISSSSGNH